MLETSFTLHLRTIYMEKNISYMRFNTNPTEIRGLVFSARKSVFFFCEELLNWSSKFGLFLHESRHKKTIQISSPEVKLVINDESNYQYKL